MGTIGDLLGGLDLSAFGGDDSTDQTTNTEQHSAPGEPNSEVEEVVMAALLEHTTLTPQSARADLTLRGDLDMDDLQLYAVVVAVERSLKRSFADQDIRQWQTIGDILDAVRQ